MAALGLTAAGWYHHGGNWESQGTPLALIWSRQDGDTHYEVRRAGNSLRLYTNGVFHSQYNPNHPVTGSVWDLLMLPAFFNPVDIRRVLVLGVGGGAVIRQLNHFLAAEAIVGIELNPVHLTVAKRFFRVNAPNVVLHCADALQWVKDYRGPGFDMIIDDLFNDAHGDPQRVVAADRRWFVRLGRLLRPRGVIVTNFGSARELRQCAWFSDSATASRYPAAYQLQTPLYENAIGAFLREPATTQQLRSNLQNIAELDERRRACRLNYQIIKCRRGEPVAAAGRR